MHDPYKNISPTGQILAWQWTGLKSLSEPRIESLKRKTICNFVPIKYGIYHFFNKTFQWTYSIYFIDQHIAAPYNIHLTIFGWCLWGNEFTLKHKYWKFFFRKCREHKNCMIISIHSHINIRPDYFDARWYARSYFTNRLYLTLVKAS